MKRLLTLSIISFFVWGLTACAQPATPTIFDSQAVESTPTEAIAISPTYTQEAAETVEPDQDSIPTALPPTSAPITETPHSGPNFAKAFSGGAAESFYTEQDISMIAKTGRIQFLNVYANW